MSYFLWVEDFENEPRITASQVLGGICDEHRMDSDRRRLKQNLKPQGIFIQLNFQDGLAFINSSLHRIDYIILDIDLPAYGMTDTINDEVLAILTNYEGYQPNEDEATDETLCQEACARLKQIAGFHLYTKLVVELGFPKQHILFCSNHGENTNTIQEAFRTAKIEPPEIIQKSDPKVQEWVITRFNNHYSRLRRGIIEACEYLEHKPSRFNQYAANANDPVMLDVGNYLQILKSFLPLQEPGDPKAMYKLFVRTVAHEWEAVRPKRLDNNREVFAFSWIMKIARNWSAHTRVFDRLEAQDVAFLFIVNMRAMFDLSNSLESYEEQLLRLFAAPLEEDQFRQIYGNNFRDRQIPLMESYAQLIGNHGNNYQVNQFHNLLNEYQRHVNPNDENSSFFIRGLYQVFWFLTSNGFVQFHPHTQRLNYFFGYFDYGEKPYLLDIGRHIYNSSFPNA